MKVASLKEGGRDGSLVVVSEDLTRAIYVPDIAPTLQAALDDWAECEAQLEGRYDQLNSGWINGTVPFDQKSAHSPLPRAYLWCEGSVFMSHMERCRRASGRDHPHLLYIDPGMHEGGSDTFVGPRDPMVCPSDTWDLDLEAGICVITDDVPMGISEEDAIARIKLVLLVNDFSLRALQIPEMAKGMGCVQSKPANAFSPVAVSPSSLGDAWRSSMLARPVHVWVNNQLIGAPIANEDATFDLPRLIAHLARTRNICAGAIIGAGTISNQDEGKGVACLYEKRSLEILNQGHAETPWLRFGDTIKIECFDDRGASIFGKIEQSVQPLQQGEG
jgi:fumarylacetoacetate (FAA) hydrolase